MAVDLTELGRRLSTHRPRVVPAWPGIRRAGVALVLRAQAATPELLFAERATRRGDPWSGNMAFPGGLAQAADRDTQATAVREAREEVGLDLERDAERIGRLGDALALGPDARPLAISPHVFVLTSSVEPRTSREVRGTHWVSLLELLEEPDPRRHVVQFLGLPLRFACYRHEGRVIWGLTLRMVGELRRVALGS